MATARFSHAVAELSRARDMVALGQSVFTMMGGRVDPSDMYRAAIVQAVSTMDHYFHGVLIDRAVDMIVGRLTVPASESRKVGLTFDAVREITQAPTPVEQEMVARKHAAERLARETLQQPDDIAVALGMVGVTAVWVTAFGANAKAQKVALGLVVTRRNRIVHQSDGDPLNPGTPTPISDADALTSINTVEHILTAMDPLC